MNVFNIPNWESSSAGDKSAKELLFKNVNIKAFKGKKPKKTKAINSKHKKPIEQKKNQVKLKAKITKISDETQHKRNTKSKNKFQLHDKKSNKVKNNFLSKNDDTPHKHNNKSKHKFQLHDKKSNVKNKFLSKKMHNKQNEIVEKLSLVKSNNSNKTKANTLIEKINKKKNKFLSKKMHNKQNETVEKLSLVKSNNSNKTKANTLIEKINKKKIARLKRKQKQVANFQTKLENTDETSKGNVEKPDLKDTIKMSNKQIKKLKLMNLLKTKTNFPKTDTTNKKKKPTTLKERMMEKLKTSRFRYLNEQIYNSEGKKAQQFFQSDPDAFHAYHDGYSQQVTKWPLNPLNNIIKSIKKMPSDYVIADFGCGEANLAKSVSQKVHSFDFVAMNEYITPCDMAHVPLENESVNVAVFCLSLMGTNIRDYLYEANRVLKTGGKLKIAEVESRFDKVEVFIEGVKKFGFKYVWKDLSHKLFYFIDFEKISKCKPLSKLPTIGLHPCLYKKR